MDKSFKKKGVFSFFLLVGVAFLFLSIHVLLYLYLPPQDQEIHKIIDIPDGAHMRVVADLLHREGLIKNKEYFIILGKLTLTEKNIHPGEYDFHTRMLPQEILNLLKKGKIIQYEVSIPEGYTSYHIADLLEEKKLGNRDDFIRLVHDPELIHTLHLNVESLEGYLFPSTYFFPRRIKTEDIIKKMVTTFFQEYTPDIQEAAQQMKLTQQEIVTLASIIERETNSDEERAWVSAVFHNRLKKNIPLQSDPTVIYEMKGYTGKITKKMLLTKTPYNTYKLKGLPAGPISNPGKRSLEAAVHPAAVEYLYFVSKNNGTHYFSTSLKEHNKAVHLFQKQKHARN
ncbi:MAG: endolytic transglycosylase MltG [Nitrospirae bacterium]|nr:endolytic transglycosylase MltG [Nitrospirota bacterium]MBI3353083.1 endolytic transglycosylase MltG [Nitrospirota bacterium]